MGPVLIFDADRGMCTRFAHSGLVRSARVRSVDTESIDRNPGLARIVRGLGIDRRAFAAAMVLVEGGRVHVGARAFNVLLVRAGGWPARAGAVLSLPLVGGARSARLPSNRRPPRPPFGVAGCVDVRSRQPPVT